VVELYLEVVLFLKVEEALTLIHLLEVEQVLLLEVLELVVLCSVVGQMYLIFQLEVVLEVLEVVLVVLEVVVLVVKL
jgi:hypothetical protein